MARQSLIVEVKILDHNGAVIQTMIETYDSSYGYEVERIFEKLGERFADVMDPTHVRRSG